MNDRIFAAHNEEWSPNFDPKQNRWLLAQNQIKCYNYVTRSVCQIWCLSGDIKECEQDD